MSSAGEVPPSDHINMSDLSLNHNYNNVSFARSNNNVCSINYFSNLEGLNQDDNHALKHGSEANGILDTSSHESNNQRQMNTIQMVRPIPKFTTFGNGNQNSSNPNYPLSNNGYPSQGINLPRGMHSGSEEDLHRALPIYLPSEGESTSSLSCASVNDFQVGYSGSNVIHQLNDFSNLSLLSEDARSYRQQLLHATERQLNQFHHGGAENGSSLHINNFSTLRDQTLSNYNTTSNNSEDIQNQQPNKPPPLPARLHPPSSSPHQQQQSPSSLTFFPPVVHQFPGRSVKPMRKKEHIEYIVIYNYINSE